jgi:hypothetical protein
MEFSLWYSLKPGTGACCGPQESGLHHHTGACCGPQESGPHHHIGACWGHKGLVHITTLGPAAGHKGVVHITTLGPAAGHTVWSTSPHWGLLGPQGSGPHHHTGACWGHKRLVHITTPYFVIVLQLTSRFHFIQQKFRTHFLPVSAYDMYRSSYSR